jgi:serine/threonine protein kinase
MLDLALVGEPSDGSHKGYERGTAAINLGEVRANSIDQEGIAVPILTPQERIGTYIRGRYRIERLLARGGMSVLFEAHDTRTFRSVAVKVLKTDDCTDERRVARFLQEMRLTAELRAPNVVDVLDLGQEDTGVPYLVMELLHGRTLQAELELRETLGIEDTLAALLPVMAALAAVHSAGVVHRDVKPDNIFLHRDAHGQVIPKLLDFGIAKLVCATLDTRTGAVLGTPDYMAPEQVLGGEIGPATDVWATGAVLYRALRGETPFRSATPAQVLAKLTSEPSPALRVPGLPSGFCAAVDRALVRDVSGRYSDMREFATALALCAREAGFAVPKEAPRAPREQQAPTRSPRTSNTEPSLGSRPLPTSRQRPSWLALVALVLLGGAAIASATFAPNGSAVATQRERAERLGEARLVPTAKGARDTEGMSRADRLAASVGGSDVPSQAIANQAAGPNSADAELSPPLTQMRPTRIHRATFRTGPVRDAGARVSKMVRDLPIAIDW